MLKELAAFLPGGAGGTLAEAGERLGMSENAVKVAVHRLRQRFRDAFREEIAETVDRVQDVDDELRHVIEALGY